MKKRTADRHGPRKKNDRLLLMAAGIFLVLSAVCRFVLPGVRFSSFLFLGGAAVSVGFLMLNRWAESSAAGRVFRCVCHCALAVGMLLFLCVESVILWYGECMPPEDERVGALIVLGAGVNGTTPSLTLRTRLEAAAEYLREHPEIPVVLSGGQGPGEDITEAQAMFTALTASGISPERLILEEQSTSTEENLMFSQRLLEELGVSANDPIGLVTNDFHQFRAQLIAGQEGMTVFGIPAELPWWWLNANYYIREFFALGKLFVWNLLG